MQRISVFRSRFFWRIYFTFALLTLFIFSGISWTVLIETKQSLNSEIQSSVTQSLKTLEPFGKKALNQDPHVNLDIKNVIQNFGTEGKLRFTLISLDGEVLADSHKNPNKMENHLNRTEVQESLVKPLGTSRRYSATVQKDSWYISKAIRSEDGTLLGFLRASIYHEIVNSELITLQSKIMAWTFAGILLSLMIGAWFTKRVTTPLIEINAVCEGYQRGNYHLQVNNLPNDEIGSLGNTLYQLGQEITRQISRVSQERTQLNTILAGMIEGVVSIDKDRTIRFCNSAAYELLVSSTKDARGLIIDEVDGFQLLSPSIDTVIKNRNYVENEIPSGERVLESHASWFSGAEEEGVIVVLHDVTQIRKLEKIRRDFVTNVSHEIKTPLTAIKGYGETLLMGALEDTEITKRFVKKIDANANRLVTLVQDIISLASLEAPNANNYHFHDIDWRPIVDQILSRYEIQLTTKKLSIEIKQDRAFRVLGDKEAMVQVLDNILSNALRYTPNGGSIKIFLEQQKNWGKLSVEDSGIGIPLKKQGRIFERFYRVDKARSRELGGTGLGLSIVKHLVSNMNGTVDVKSEEGKGSTFFINLPLSY